ncbi:MAG: response regulator [Cytophagales bacterium]|nr:response regulator [Cytophagales bacterium]
MKKILVAEDSIIVNQHIYKTLEGSGYKVFSAFSGKEAVQEANKHLPDLILMDIMMEGAADGIEAALKIKKTLDIPVIFLTALTDVATLDKVKDSQPFGYIVKPFNEVELLSNIQVAIHKSKVENEIKNNRDLFQASMNSISQVFLLLDWEDNIFYVNTSIEKLLNKKFNELSGMPSDKALLIKSRTTDESYSLNNLRAFSKEELFKNEFLLKTPNQNVPIGDTMLKVVNGKGGVTYTLFIFKDISNRIKARELELEIEKRRITSLIEGQENERTRLARDIHDGIGQLVNLIKLKAKGIGIKEGDAKEELDKLLEQTLKEVRNVSENLSPSGLNNFSLEKNVEKLIAQFNDSTIKFNFSHIDVPDLDLKVKSHLFRIIQEAISNILKHSKAKTSTIQLYGLENKIQLTIEDDGVGFNPNAIDKTHTHHGIQNIEYRVNSLNGNFTVDSNDKSGTMLLVTIPL